MSPILDIIRICIYVKHTNLLHFLSFKEQSLTTRQEVNNLHNEQKNCTSTDNNNLE